jgi:tRNA threonylcarbamoyladenosine biosynthesis protein TsaB
LSLILNIETATSVCSVCLSDNEKIIAYKELNEGFTHAENLHVFVRDVLKESGHTIHELEAIAVSKGPGSYTGLRIGVSAAKGLSYALNIPLIGVDTLQIMTSAVVDKTEKGPVYCPMIDARRMEVYTAVYDSNLNTMVPVNALIADENTVQQFISYSKIYFFGDGMAKCKELLQKFPNAFFIENIFPSSKNMAEIALQKFKEKKFEDVAYFEPYYLKEFFITSKKT